MVARGVGLARIRPDLDLTKIEIRLSRTMPPVCILHGAAVTGDPRVGRYSEFTMTLRHLPPTAVAFIEEMKRVLAGEAERKEAR